MGCRALIQLKYQNEVSPALYVHWLGERVEVIVEKTKAIMRTRPNDLQYAFARLTMTACLLNDEGEGNLSVGVVQKSHVLTENDSPGDCGCYVVDIENWSIQKI